MAARFFCKTLLTMGLFAALSACQDKGSETCQDKGSETCQDKGSETMPASPTLGSFGVALENMDRQVAPGDDFFRFVNGGWLAKTEIPDDKSNYGSFTVLADLSEKRVRGIIDAAADVSSKSGPEKSGSDTQKIGDFYRAFMDVERIETLGMTPVKDDIARIQQAATHADLVEIMNDPNLPLRSPVGAWVAPDAKNPTEYITYLTQSGLGMGTRDYYTDEGEDADAKRAAYLSYLAVLLEQAGLETPAKRASAVMGFETKLAEVHWSNTKRRQRDLTYNKMSVEALEDYAPGYHWKAGFKTAGLGDQTAFILREKDAIQKTAKIFAAEDLQILKDYLSAGYLSMMSAYLPKTIDDAHFEFYGRTMRGTKTQRVRWKRAVSEIDSMMGEIVGRVYVETYFKSDAKAQMEDLVENLRAAFRDGIDNLDWMGGETKAQAQDKLAKFNPKIGYPNEWTDYSDLKIDGQDLVGTVKAANAWVWHDELSKLGGPIDREEWGMNPQTVNAYYRPDLNEIVFPAAILQAPFFDPLADAAVNYGGIGAVIGHEMGHGFDDQGSKSDGDGRQVNWWTDEDLAGFKSRTAKLVAQYDAFEPLPGLHVNGELTLGENIGDLTGLTMAYQAYRKSLNGAEAPVLEGLTGDQRFFLAYGQIWARKFRDDALRSRIKTDPHSPGEYRANGIVRNFDPWYAAFDVTPDHALYLPPEARVKIW